MKILSYNSRIHILDKFLSYIERNTTNKHTTEVKQQIKFYLLITIHLLLLLPIYVIIFFSRNIYLLILSICILYIQLLLNIYDNGCFLMKLERKYVGKHWYGFYTPLVKIFNLESSHVNWLFYIFAFSVLTFISKKIFLLL
jgi:hypothetical protein